MVRQVLSGAATALAELLQCEESQAVVRLLEAVLVRASSRTQYWLVRQELSLLLSSQGDSLAASYSLGPGADWEGRRLASLLSLLCDEDGRVRGAAAQALVQISVQGPVCPRQPLTSQAAGRLAGQILSSSGTRGRQVGASDGVEPLAQILHMLGGGGATTTDRTLLSGCLEFLALYCQARPPPQFPSHWPALQPSLALLTRTIQLAVSSPVCQDLAVHCHLLTVCGHLYSGLALSVNRRQTGGAEDWSGLVPGDPVLSQQADLLLGHLIKLLAILHHVIEDHQLPSPPSSKPSLPSLPNTALSPIKKKSSVVGESSGPVSPPATDKTFSLKAETEKKLRGQFVGSPFYMKQYELVRASHGIYLRSLEPRSEEKLLSFTESVLDCLSALLDVSLGSDASIGKLVEECLGYVKSCLVLSANKSLRMVKTLLRCLFKCNQPFDTVQDDKIEPVPPPLPPSSELSTVFDILISSPYTRMTVDFSLVTEGGETVSTVSSTDYGRRSHSLTSSRQADRSSLAGYIRMFEPIVIKALKLYTVSSDISVQCQVLQLLIQLVRLRVNYCLLDSDQIFIGFVTKQLEAIQEGEINKADLLVPDIFEFLILLSYEKYHSKTIITRPKIIQLIKGLAASRDQPHSLVIPALEVVAVDLFSVSPVSQEVLTQQEVVVNMLLGQLAHSQVWLLLARVLELVGGEEREEGEGEEREEREERARRLSSQIIDALLPLLCSHSVQLSSPDHLRALNRLFSALSPCCLRPCDRLISALMSSTCDLTNMAEVTSWLAFSIASFLAIFRLSPEEAVVGRLQELGIMLGSGGGSLTSSGSEIEQSCSAEITLAVFLLHLVGSGVSKLHQLVFCLSTTSRAKEEQEGRGLLEQELADLLLLLTFILQSGQCPRLARAVISVAATEEPGVGQLHHSHLITQLVLEVSASCPVLSLQWLYVLVLLEQASPQVWARLLCVSPPPANTTRVTDQSEPAASLNREVIRQGSISVLANHLVNINNSDTELLAWFLSSQIKEIVANIRDPGIKEFVSVVHRQAPASGLFLEAVAARIESMRSRADYLTNILVCLHNLHPAHTGRLICLLVNKFLPSPLLAIASKAAGLAVRRVELLLGEREERVREQLGQTEVAALKDSLARRAPHSSRHSRTLLGLINRLAVAFYDLSPLESSSSSSETGRKFSPSSLAGLELDKTWYLGQVRRSCCGPATAPPKECARLLSNLGLSDIMVVMTSKDFRPNILEECLVQGISLPDSASGRAPSIDSLDRLPGLQSNLDRSPIGKVKEGPPLYRHPDRTVTQSF